MKKREGASRNGATIRSHVLHFVFKAYARVTLADSPTTLTVIFG